MVEYKKLLMVIDPQIDFISGSLPVPGAAEAMNALGDHIQRRGNEYCHIIVTADCHPISHCSFKRNGGEWATHCVADSIGAAIWQPVMDSLIDYKGKVSVFHKGMLNDKEEYSIFCNPEAAEKICRIISSEEIVQIDICGLAGDVCVAETLKDGKDILKDARFNVLTEFTASLDGGIKLNKLVSEITYGER